MDSSSSCRREYPEVLLQYFVLSYEIMPCCIFQVQIYDIFFRIAANYYLFLTIKDFFILLLAFQRFSVSVVFPIYDNMICITENV